MEEVMHTDFLQKILGGILMNEKHKNSNEPSPFKPLNSNQELHQKITLRVLLPDLIAAFGSSRISLGIYAALLSLWLVWNISKYNFDFHPTLLTVFTILIPSIVVIHASFIMMSLNLRFKRSKQGTRVLRFQEYKHTKNMQKLRKQLVIVKRDYAELKRILNEKQKSPRE
jgi:uncharacterized membrane protein